MCLYTMYVKCGGRSAPLVYIEFADSDIILIIDLATISLATQNDKQ